MKRIKIFTLLVIIILFIISFSFNSQTVLQSVAKSLIMCGNSVIPALFPFFVLSEMLMLTLSLTSINPTIYAFIGGLIAGFPTGTKNVCELYQSNILTKKQATSLLYCTANASPAYIISFIGICVIKSKTIGIIILISQIICAFICAFTFGAFKKSQNINFKAFKLTNAICSAVSGSVAGCLNVCGYIIFMGIIADLFSQATVFNSIKAVKPLIIGAIEITRGIETVDLTNKNNVTTLAMIVGFSGFSVILQCINQCKKSDLSVKPIIIGKIIYALLMPFLTYILIKIIPVHFSNRRSSHETLLLIIFTVFLGIFFYILFDKLYKRIYNSKKRDR